MKSLFFFFLYIFIVEIRYTLAEFDLGTGYCTKLVSYKKSRRVSYIETYQEKKWGLFYKTKFRVNYKTEYYTDFETKNTCCYQYIYQFGECVPTCITPCGHGECIRPNMCKCYDGYLPLSFNDTVCTPVCKYSCVHGYCSERDTCTCDSGYQIKSDRFTCEPICNPKCNSATTFCSKPNTCTCKEGYKQINDKTCMPICDIPCINGNCTAPDTCTCNKGYVFDLMDKFTCKPICNKCINGICTAPDVCTCRKGYSLTKEGYCKPVCSKPCHMGTCIAPDICMCHDGYGFLSNSTNICEPICPKACINGSCTHPNVCKCHEGFHVKGDETSLHICTPHCELQCEPDGKCTAPNVCTCNAGYSLGDSGTIYFQGQSVCKPICEKTCINGFCTAPNFCSCLLGYRHSDVNNVCIPFCESSCGPHSSCTAPNECTCEEGYNMVKNEENSYKCEPNCQPACPPNSICESPGFCRCKEGYDIDDYDLTNCVPICTFDCQNGNCSSPNTCSCEPGYINNENGSCVAYCSESCGNGACTEPEVCTCDVGYVSTYKNQTCKPYCTNGCNNGVCVAPDDCQCNEGFIKNGNTTDSICVSACKDACNDKGICLVDQGICDCFYGWNGIACEKATFCVVVVSEEFQIYETLSIIKEKNDSIIFVNKTNPTCQQCLNEVNNETMCFKFPYNLYDEENNSTICLVDASSMCYTNYSNRKDVTKVIVASGGITVLIIIIAIAIAYYTFKKRNNKSNYLLRHSQK